MAWKDNLRSASFRGVPFYVDTSQWTGGRRVANHEFPDRDLPYAEDIGKVGNTFKVEGHLLGDDYFAQKAALKTACEKYGPGWLIHPYHGSKFVQCGVFSIDEDTREGGICKISFQFYETSGKPFPKAVNDKNAILQGNVASALAASKASFDSKFSLLKAPGFVVSSAQLAVTKLAKAYTAATASTRQAIEATANFAYQVKNLTASVSTLLAAPGKLSQYAQDTFKLLESAIGVPTGSVQAYSTFYAFSGSLAAPAVTPARIQEQNNKYQFDSLIQRSAVAGAVGQASQIQFTSSADAIAMREVLRTQIENILANCDDDNVFTAFENLNASVMDTLPDTDSDLPNLRTVSFGDTLPSLVIAYELFELASAEDDIISRNKIQNPGFIVGGTELEVLNVVNAA